MCREHESPTLAQACQARRSRLHNSSEQFETISLSPYRLDRPRGRAGPLRDDETGATYRMGAQWDAAKERGETIGQSRSSLEWTSQC
jgi:hypothetical protein